MSERKTDERGWDVEVAALCDAMNEVPGIRTIESCSGHEREEFVIYFKAESLEALPRLLYWFDGCHSGCYGWRVEAGTDCGMSPVTFSVRGPVGAFSEADDIARLIREYGESEWRQAERERKLEETEASA